MKRNIATRVEGLQLCVFIHTIKGPYAIDISKTCASVKLLFGRLQKVRLLNLLLVSKNFGRGYVRRISCRLFCCYCIRSLCWLPVLLYLQNLKYFKPVLSPRNEIFRLASWIEILRSNIYGLKSNRRLMKVLHNVDHRQVLALRLILMYSFFWTLLHVTNHN